ncbi:peptide chain release factor 2 [Vairimorpha apis BRL 01]|uniref:Peptide chain release factor 2 n=1 Tax=Vairimorpha apis BRL 01 TaxID=1037528 RepID=T0L869_9MICR|nr:peptide chain release factor 2 [Vairimorpha apis BRL 01]
MEEINNLYQDVQDIESIIFDFNKIKTHITFLENETASLKMKLDPDFKQSLELKIDHLEQEYKKIENEIKRIDLSSKDCYTISEIKALFEILNDKKVIMEKCISFTNSLIYDLSISSETFAKISLKNECKYGTYKY